ncbi:lysoplasmalogenase [Chitinophaga defluvii]|uniref:Lysoplasmalogenase n=1 Tax=Chitinophaga defluvii TaxID=3163343 RepID=A0ABV2T8L8_9BACT
MLKSIWLVLYFITLLADLIFVGFDMGAIRFTSKPLLMVLLALYFMSNTGHVRAIYRYLLLAALAFSFGGDVLLMFDGRGMTFFIAGLGSFLLAHMMYILFFLKIRYTNDPRPDCHYFAAFITEAIVIAFIFFMLPYLGDMTIPVIIYAIGISFTLLCALHAFRLQQQTAGWYCILGAILFIISDSLIAVGKFYQPIPLGGVLVMLTYGLAQAGLVYGSTRYLNSRV